ncbi:MAG: hypothetical protein SGJ18_00660 [Pseudomonadota bacterium]|nr:hypothetical protein [Pseudomonadota bacterium]
MSKVTLSLLSLLAAILFFQNCSKVGFSSNSGNLTKVAGDPGATSANVSEDGDDNLLPLGDGEGEGEVVEEDGDDDSDGLAANYICILKGPGKSIRVGFVGGELVEHGRTPKVVCMSRSACLNIISKAFDVKYPVKRGFCPNKNPHVIPFSDSELQDLI